MDALEVGKQPRGLAGTEDGQRAHGYVGMARIHCGFLFLVDARTHFVMAWFSEGPMSGSPVAARQPCFMCGRQLSARKRKWGVGAVAYHALEGAQNSRRPAVRDLASVFARSDPPVWMRDLFVRKPGPNKHT